MNMRSPRVAFCRAAGCVFHAWSTCGLHNQFHRFHCARTTITPQSGHDEILLAPIVPTADQRGHWMFAGFLGVEPTWHSPACSSAPALVHACEQYNTPPQPAEHGLCDRGCQSTKRRHHKGHERKKSERPPRVLHRTSPLCFVAQPWETGSVLQSCSVLFASDPYMGFRVGWAWKRELVWCPWRGLRGVKQKWQTLSRYLSCTTHASAQSTGFPVPD
jgi:hypothetical protein